MAKQAGRKAKVEISTDNGTTWTAVKGLDSASFSSSLGTIDVSDFDKAVVQRLAGLSDITASLSGSFDAADTNGQIALRSANLNGTEVQVRFLPTGTPDAASGIKASFLVTGFDWDAAAADKQGLSIELEGSGTLAATIV